MRQKDNNSNQALVADSISRLPDQLTEAWQEAKKIKIPASFACFDAVVFCGMGGSNLVSELVRNIFRSEIKKPFVLVRGYNLPAFVGPNTLVFISSYSGNTEETVSCLKQALAKGAKVISISTGGQVISLTKKNKKPFYQLNASSNPSRQPRYGVGMQLGAVLAILSKLKVVKVSGKRIGLAADRLKTLNDLLAVSGNSGKNLAKDLAAQFVGKMPVIVAAEIFSGNAHILANQINESAKSFSTYFLIPELNHHLLEGLKEPSSATKKLKFLFLNSSQYSSSITKRFLATQKVLKKQKVAFVEYFVDCQDGLVASLEVLLLGSWLSFYLARANKQDPTKIPWVKYFKDVMKK